MEFPFEKRAIKGAELPQKMDVADTYAYLSLRCLYRDFKMGNASKVEARREKERIFAAWSEAKSKLAFLDRSAMNLSTRIGEAAREYAEKPSKKTADRFYAALYNLPDDWRERISESAGSQD